MSDGPDSDDTAFDEQLVDANAAFDAAIGIDPRLDAAFEAAVDESRYVELFDRLWGDLRRRDDRSEFSECSACGRAVRWVANLGSATGSAIQIVAKPVTTAAFYDPEEHAGLVAVYTDRTGFTVSRFTQADDVEGAFFYRCHWDVCDHARRERDRISRERRAAAAPIPGALEPDPDVVMRYAAWRESQRD